jgi:3-hydroxymyristoyl/3-hydroxydecanoyl-(acyl carrier protein) dehydratase
VPAWYKANTSNAQQINLNAEDGLALFQIKNNKKHFRLATPQLNFLDTLTYVKDGGTHGKGYMYGYKDIDPADWFYNCHFYQDPVMPGSLGVEAMLQAMQAFAIKADLGAAFTNPGFTQLAPHQTHWKYRGQIVPANAFMALEVHITDIVNNGNSITIMAEGSVWKENIRIYEVKNLAMVIQEISA